MTAKTDLPEFDSLEPKLVWRLFAGIAATPRPSKKEERIREHIRNLAGQNGLVIHEDRAGNIVISVLASPGHEQADVTVLQGHLDMVPEKNASITHDFEKDPIRLILDRDPTGGELIVRAEGTTLGADNGIGVAMALAAACSPEVVHGALELLFTTDEEAGMTGAKVLSPDSFSGRRLLNLDSEEDDALCIGCAGGCDTTLTWDFEAVRAPAGGEAARVTVAGLRGGHSGSDIHENRGNAIKLLAETLSHPGLAGISAASLTGGSKRNAIAREAAAVVTNSPGMLAAVKDSARRVRDEAQAKSREKGLTITVEPLAVTDVPAVLSARDTSRLLTAITALPHGVLGLHPSFPGLVETSNNVATVSSEPRNGQGGSLQYHDGARIHVTVGTLTRSSSAAWLQAVLSQIAAVGHLAGATIETANDYPGWEPNARSPILATCRKVYEMLFGEPPKVEAIHAGLECGIIGERIGGMDMISFGPRIEGAHTPEERVYVASVEKSWRYLLAVLKELA